MSESTKEAPKLVGGTMEHIEALRRGPLGFFQAGAAQHKDIFYFEIMGISFYVLIHPDLVKDVLITHWKDFQKIGAVQLFGNGLITSNGRLWQQQRTLMQPYFTKKSISNHFLSILSITKENINKINLNTEFDINKYLKYLTFEIACQILFGEKVQINHKLYEAFSDLKKGNVPTLLAVINKSAIQIDPNVERAKQIIRDFVDQLIERRRKEASEAQDVLSELLRARDPKTGYEMSAQQLHDEVLTLMLAGHETTENALLWTFYLLGKHPEVKAKVFAEIDTYFSSGELTIATLEKLKCLKMVFQESMRVLTPVWQVVVRQTPEDIQIGEYRIPANAKLMISPFLTHRHQDFWENPEEFNPDRFADESSIHKCSYIPFGFGARQCIGMDLSYLEALAILALFLQKFDLHLKEEVQLKTSGPILVPTQDILLNLNERNK